MLIYIGNCEQSESENFSLLPTVSDYRRICYVHTGSQREREKKKKNRISSLTNYWVLKKKESLAGNGAWNSSSGWIYIKKIKIKNLWMEN